MGEIKSTLDLVLEKTRHLSQSSGEKQAQTQKDTDNRINGMLQKYLDEQWRREAQALNSAFEQKLNQEKDRLGGG